MPYANAFTNFFWYWGNSRMASNQKTIQTRSLIQILTCLNIDIESAFVYIYTYIYIFIR